MTDEPRTPQDERPPADGQCDPVQDALESEDRVVLVSIALPDSNPIPEELKVAVCERVQALRKQQRWTYRDVTHQLGGKPNEDVISAVLRRQYASPDDKVIRRLNAWLESTGRRLAALRPEGVVSTSIVRAIAAGCEYAKSQVTGVIIVGPSGVGKTFAARAVCCEDPNAIYIRLRSTHNSPTAFLAQLADACGLPGRGSRARLLDTIVDKLGGSHRLLICDEWHLAGRPLYEALRDIHDEAGIPFVLLGTDVVQQRVTESRVRRGATWSDQFSSRVGWLIDLTRLRNSGGTPRPLFTLAEVRDIFRSERVRISRDGLDFLQGLSCAVGLGCLRLARRCFEMAARIARRDNCVITARHLRAAFVSQCVPEGAGDSILLHRVEEVQQEVRRLVAG